MPAFCQTLIVEFDITNNDKVISQKELKTNILCLLRASKFLPAFQLSELPPRRYSKRQNNLQE